MKANMQCGLKQGPNVVTVKQSSHKILDTSIRLDNNGAIYFTFSNTEGFVKVLGSDLSASVAPQIVSSKSFETKIQNKLPELMAAGEDIDIKLLELKGLSEAKRGLDTNNWEGLMDSLSEAMLEASIDGDMVTQLENNKYVLVQKAGENSQDALEGRLLDIAKRYVPEGAINVQSKNIEGNLPELSAREASRAILYTINKMEKSGLAGSSDNLKASFDAFLLENTNNIKNLKHRISHQLFWVCFQPIVDLKTRAVSHHEVLARFEENVSPYALIALAEDVGISHDVDLSVYRQTIKHLDKHRQENLGELSVNLSGSSVQNEAFIQSLLATIKQYPVESKNISFEVTESSGIKNFEMVNNFLQQLRGMGHKVYLDDFGAGAASFEYIQKLDVDAIKIDGAYTKIILSSPREATMVKSLTQMCHDLDIKVVAEMVETEAQASFLNDIGVDKGQGWLFGKAEREILKG